MQQNTIAKKRIFLALFFCALLFCVVLAIGAGRYPIPFNQVLASLWGAFCSKQANVPVQVYNVVIFLRLPRIVLSVLVGASLSAAGSVYQGVFQNPLASPDILGASTGAAFGAALAILAGKSGLFVVGAGFFCSIVGLALVFLLASTGQNGTFNLLLAGMAVSSLFGAGISLIKLLADPQNQLPNITYWLMGSFAGTGLQNVLLCAAVCAPALFLLFIMRWRANLLYLPTAEMRTAGTNPALLRTVFCALAGLLTAACVAASGQIGWVGLVVPHFTRRFLGGDTQFSLPACAVLGSIFLLAVDTFCRTVFPVEIPLGILTAFLGAPFLLFLLAKGGGGNVKG